jgi:hypothetical protein
MAKAGGRTRTGDPVITSDVLYQLSYAGAGIEVIEGYGASASL